MPSFNLSSAAKSYGFTKRKALYVPTEKLRDGKRETVIQKQNGRDKARQTGRSPIKLVI
jgi:hypothetical protein